MNIRMKLPQCDFCSYTAVYDAKTFAGPWAFMCQGCFNLHGKGLGIGKGEKLRRAHGDIWDTSPKEDQP